MKFGGHETFHLRDNWIYKGLKMLENKGDLFGDSEKSIEYLGVGTNMVKSIRHWLVATRLINLENGKAKINNFGNLLLEHDQYFDQLGSAWILHYFLTSNKENATAWYWFFNKFGVSEFSSEDVSHYLNIFCSTHHKKVNSNTLTKDINTLLRMYVVPEFTGNKTPEDSDICPLSTLSLIVKQSNGKFKINPPEIDEIPIEIFGYCLINFWIEHLQRVPEFSFDELLKKDCSPVKVFCLNNDKASDLLDRLVEFYPKQFSYKRSGGIFAIKIHSPGVKKLLNAYYGE